MVFSSIVFLCLYLPSVVALYYVCPVRLRNLFLLFASLLFYAWGEPVYILIMLFSTVFDYVNGRLIEWCRSGRRERLAQAVLAVSVAGNLCILGFFKYADFAVSIANRVTGGSFPQPEIALPIGISFYTFQTMSYTIDVYRGLVPAQHNIISFGMYVCMFPQLIAGPIVRYADVAGEIDRRGTDTAMRADGLQRFLLGLGKKVLLANQIGVLWDEVGGLGIQDMSAALAWLGAFAYTFQIYFDFSGYSDMAIGLGEMFGFHFPENFRYPYESRSITEFWRRWHMTLSGWFREYVYIPLGGSRCGLARQILNLFTVWALTGLWHGAGWNFVLWGLYYFVLLITEKILFKVVRRLPAGESGKSSRKQGGLKSLSAHAYTIFFVVVGWVIFACDDVSQLMDYLGMLAGNGVPLTNRLAAYECRSYAVLFIILILASTRLPLTLGTHIQGWIGRHAGACTADAVRYFWCLIVLAVSIALLVSGSYNPFLYFRF